MEPMLSSKAVSRHHPELSGFGDLGLTCECKLPGCHLLDSSAQALGWGTPPETLGQLEPPRTPSTLHVGVGAWPRADLGDGPAQLPTHPGKGPRYPSSPSGPLPHPEAAADSLRELFLSAG